MLSKLTKLLFMFQKNYDCHMLTHNTDEALPHQCRYCMKRFSNPEHLNRHTIEHTENITYSEKYKRVRCTKCRRSFLDKEKLKEHACVPLRKCKGISCFCRICKKRFPTHSALYNHNKNIHKAKIKVRITFNIGN